MKNRLATQYPTFQFSDLPSAENIYIADFSRDSDSKRGVEVSDKAFEGIKYLCVDNRTKTPLSFAHIPLNGIWFKRRSNGDWGDQERCEGCLFADIDIEENPFLLFVEIKHCQPKIISRYFEQTKNQILNTVKNFRKDGVITEKKKVFAIISFPNRDKTAFNDFLFANDLGIQKREFETNHINIIGTNRVEIIDNKIFNIESQ